jgi:Fic family protein
MNFIYGLIAGIVVATIVCLIWPKKKETKTEEKVVYMSGDEAKKKENLAKVEEFVAKNDKITNDDIQNLLGVSDKTATRYLDELESQGALRQVGGQEKGTYYEKI